MRIVVLAGGLSMERNVSLSSGTRICRALRERGHQAVLVDMFLGLEGYAGAPESISTRQTACAANSPLPARSRISMRSVQAGETRARACSARMC